MQYLLSYLYGFLLALIVTSHVPTPYPFWPNPYGVGALVLIGALLVGHRILPISASKIIGWTLGILWGLLHGAPPAGHLQIGQSFQVVSRNPWQFQPGPFLATLVKSSQDQSLQGPQLQGRPETTRFQLYGPHQVGTIGVLTSRDKTNFQPLWSPNGSKQFYLKRHPDRDSDIPKIEAHTLMGRINLLNEALKSHIKSLCQRFIPGQKHMISSWLIGIYLGDQSEIPETIKEGFKRVGLYHLLSLGGLHITVLTALGTFILKAPLIVLYGSGVVLRPHFWGWFLQILNLFCIGFALLFLVMSGATPAVQRAVFLYVLTLSGLLFWGKQSLSKTMIWGLCLQSLVFPIGFLSEASVMSWVCYLRVGLLMEAPAGVRQKIFETLKLQGELAVMGGAFFGQFSFAGLVVNGALIGVFTALFVLSLGLLLPQIRFLDAFALQLHRSFLDLVMGLAEFTAKFRLSYLELNELDWKVRGIFILLTAFFVLSNFKKRTIGSMGRNAYVKPGVER